MTLRKNKDFYPRSYDDKKRREYDIELALNGISKIKPLIHQIRLSANCSYEVLTNALGELSPADIKYELKTKKEMPNYRKKAYINFEKKVITVYYYPIYGYLPKFILSPNSSNYEYLDKIGKAFLPYIANSENAKEFELVNIFSIEYTIDFFCNPPKDKNVSNLFYIFRRYFFAPKSKKIEMIGGKFYGLGDTRKENAVYKIRYAKRRKHIKIYERGPDKKKRKMKGKKDKGWRYDDEFQLPTNGSVLSRKLRFSESALLHKGIKISRPSRTSKERLIRIKWI